MPSVTLKTFPSILMIQHPRGFATPSDCPPLNIFQHTLNRTLRTTFTRRFSVLPSIIYDYLKSGFRLRFSLLLHVFRQPPVTFRKEYPRCAPSFEMYVTQQPDGWCLVTATRRKRWLEVSSRPFCFPSFRSIQAGGLSTAPAVRNVLTTASFPHAEKQW